ncbi:MAG TPA: ribonuclease P protein component [Gammaproteobacteria bacterium]|nr:ribonuclease P protein component [Gammaproteobacteria bacterium]
MPGTESASRGFPQAQRLKRPEEFRRVFDQGSKAVGRFFVVFARPVDGGPARLGVAVSRKVGNAVRRNRIKRVIREEFRQACGLGRRELVVVARTSAANAGRDELVRDLRSLWKRVSHA